MAPAIPKKPSVKPAVPVRQLHWGKIPDAKIKGTVWETELDDSRVSLETSDLETLFAVKAPTKLGGGIGGGKSAGPTKTDMANLLDQKTANNTSIALSRFKMDVGDIAAALKSGQEGRLNADQLASLLAILPSPEDIELVQGYDGPAEALNKAELFFRAVAAVPKCQLRVRCLLIRATFEEKKSELDESVKLISSAVKEVRSSAALKRVLELTLALGNYLNGGTNKGGAWGFKLDSLSKLTGTKTTDGKSTLLHYIASLLEKQAKQRGDEESDAVVLLRQMPSAEAAARVVWADEGAEVNALMNSLKQVSGLVETDTIPAFKESLGAFHERASAAADELSKAHTAADEACTSLAAWLAEDVKGGKAEPERIFSALHTFAMALEKAHLYNVECEEREAKKQRMAAAAKQREEEMSKRRAAGGPETPRGGPETPRGGPATPRTGPKPPPGAMSLSIGAGVPPRPGFGGLANDELAAKLAKRANRANLVDGVTEGMASGKIIAERRQNSFARRGAEKKAPGGRALNGPSPVGQSVQVPVLPLPSSSQAAMSTKLAPKPPKPRPPDVKPALLGAGVTTRL
mmetsp:Transcript_71482/g.98994  ORF Transcript_71482/g.98994 Transcript_71482/m.98994 type:complete len:576 (-) Transcript_71482:409-2136(-)